MTFAYSVLAALLTAAVANAATFDDALIALFEDEDPILPGDLLADLTLATYEGYANSTAVVWGTVHIDTAGRSAVHCAPKEFKPTGDATQSTVRQVGLLNAAGTAVLASYILDEPITFTDANSVHLIGFPLVLTQPDGEEPNIIP